MVVVASVAEGVTATADGAALSSLASIRRSPVGPPALRCPRKLGYFLVGAFSGAIVPARCKAHWCAVCGPLNAQEVAGAIGLTGPERFILFTRIGSSWADAQWRIEEVVRDVRAAGYRFEYCLHIEPNPKGTGLHGHLYQWGDYVPQAFLQERCLAAGMGWPDIRAWRPRGGPKVSYGLKLAGIDYGLKLAKRAEALGLYLDANGGRLAHSSRSFFRDEYGVSVGQLGGREAWRRLVVGDAAEEWQLVCRPDWEES